MRYSDTVLPNQALPEAPFADPPPPFDRQLNFSTVWRAGWLPLYQDRCHEITLRNELTGAIRSAPWISLRTEHGRVYFANLVTWQTRWFPPQLWMEGWIDRGQAEDGCGGLNRIPSDGWDRTIYARRLLPAHVARLYVEGGAPYLHSYGSPRYAVDKFDSADSHPSCAIA